MYVNISKHKFIVLKDIALHVFPTFHCPPFSFFIHPTFHNIGLHIQVGMPYTGNH